MNILLTGAKGFIGKHVYLKLNRLGHNIFSYDIDNTVEELKEYVSSCDFIIHLAGINRPLTIKEFYDVNTNFTKLLIDIVKESKKQIPIIMSSSIQAELDNDYGKSKKMGEDLLFNSGLPVYIFRLSNVFGKWCKPNYNSVVATFCYNITHDLPINIRDRDYVVNYNYIDDIVNAFISILDLKEHIGSKDILSVNPIYDCSLGKLSELLYYFKDEVTSDRHLPIIHDEFELKLFKTFLDYFSDEGYSYNFSVDNRGSFEELFKSSKYGQISENISYPGITKGGHYHTYKKEIFYPVYGKVRIRQQNISTKEIIEETLSKDNYHPVEIKVGYTHEITNIGNTNSITLMWINKIYDPQTHDTYKQEIEK